MSVFVFQFTVRCLTRLDSVLGSVVLGPVHLNVHCIILSYVHGRRLGLESVLVRVRYVVLVYASVLVFHLCSRFRSKPASSLSSLTVHCDYARPVHEADRVALCSTA